MNKGWHDIFSQEIKSLGGIKNFSNIKVKEKKPLIDKIIKFCKKRDMILEAGCGTGVISSHLVKLGYNLTCLDKNEKIMNLSKCISKFFNTKINFVKGDLFHLDFPREYFNVSFSHGVLEHFEDKGIINV